MRAALLGMVMAALALPAHAACTDVMRREAMMFPGLKTFQPPEAVPEIAFQRPNGDPATLAEYRGKPTLVTFWWPRCPGCQQEGPSLHAMLERYKADGALNFVALSVQGEREEVVGYLARKGYGLIEPNIDPGAALFRDLCLMATPVHVVLNAEGAMIAVWIGPQDWTGAEATRLLDTLIATGGV